MESVPVAAVAPIAVLAVAWVAYCLFDIARAERVEYLPKLAWAAICLFSIPLGGIVYFWKGRAH
ncbi:MAG TPA: PLDc N-terminal domain-containing protein [Actinomycetota bacterium]|nr:PLDc N-terminal domain-containing protein [Actinomycetota bacterium]